MVNRDFEAYMENLGQEAFFENFTSEELNKVKAQSVIHQYGKGQIIYFQNDPKQYAYFLLKGFVRIERTDDQDAYIFIDYIKEKEFFSYNSILTFDKYIESAYSVSDIDLLLIPIQLMIQISQKNYKQLLYMYGKLSEIQIFQEARIQQIAISSAVDRVIRTLSLWMFELGRRIGGQMMIPYPMTINELALVAGTSRETAGRVVKKLSSRGCIKFSRKKIIFLDEDYFKDKAKFLNEIGRIDGTKFLKD